MNARTKTALVVCLAISIFAGFVPWFSQAEAAFKIRLSSLRENGKITCDGSTFDARLEFFAEDLGSLGKGDIGLIKILVPIEFSLFRSVFEGGVTDVQIGSHSFKISAVIEQNYCGRLKTFVELSSHGGFSCPSETPPFLEPVDIEYRAGPTPQIGQSEDTGHFRGEIECSEVAGSPVQNPGTPQSDTISGTNANNLIDGEGGNDILNGLAGNDKIIGADGSDKLNGGAGRDTLIGGTGNDELTGGPGPDTFLCGAGNDKITDFKPSEGDKKTNDCEQF